MLAVRVFDGLYDRPRDKVVVTEEACEGRAGECIDTEIIGNSVGCSVLNWLFEVLSGLIKVNKMRPRAVPERHGHFYMSGCAQSLKQRG